MTSTVYTRSCGEFISSIADKCGCPNPGSDSGSKASGGGKVVAVSGGGQPVPAVTSGPAGLETLLRYLLSGHLSPAQQPRPGSFRRDWNVVVCFSCGKVGHSATGCPTLDDSFPFMLPGWTAGENSRWLCYDFAPEHRRAVLIFNFSARSLLAKLGR